MNKNIEKSDSRLVNQLKYPTPKILLLDLDENTEQTLKKAGYCVETGSLGQPYKVNKSSGYSPVTRNYEFPENFAESEIVVSNFYPIKILDSPNVENTIPIEESNYWSHLRYGVVDSRIVTAKLFSQDFIRILSNNGIFIVFADSPYSQEIRLGHKQYNSFQKLGLKQLTDIYSALGFINNFDIESIEGKEINLTIDKDTLLGDLLNDYLEKTTFSATFSPIYSSKYKSLAENKFGQSVSGWFKVGKGSVFIFPQISDKANFIKDLLSNVLPEIFHHLFPFSESRNWLFRNEYELPEVIQLKAEIEKTREEAKTKVEQIESDIENKRREFSYLSNILTQTGDDLVESVIKTLEVLGFEKVIDADKALTEEEERVRGKMEDIQVRDYETDLLIEVKGVSGLLKDEDALAVNKYVTARMREWSKTEIKGVTIVNHQRNLPPFDRENNNPFRDIVLTNAEENLIGLLTTWELYKLTRNYIKNDWKHENIKDIFFKSGKIEYIPTNYEYIGKVERFVEDIGVVGIKIENASLNINDKIAFETEIEFEEQIVKSLQLENESVKNAQVSDLVGTETHITKGQVKLEKTRVFRVN